MDTLDNPGSVLPNLPSVPFGNVGGPKHISPEFLQGPPTIRRRRGTDDDWVVEDVEGVG